MSRFISDETAQFLNLRRLPGRLTLAQTAVLLGIGEHDISSLVKMRLLLPLGNPESNAPKFFAARQVEEMARDPVKLDKMVKTISKHWRAKNQRLDRGLLPNDAGPALYLGTLTSSGTI